MCGRPPSFGMRYPAPITSKPGCRLEPASLWRFGARFDLQPRRDPIEDLGIPGIPYEMTRADLMNGNKDLLRFCTDMLR